MRRALFGVLFLILLTACGSEAPSQPAPSATTVPSPTASPTHMPIPSTATPSGPAVIPSPTPIFFSQDLYEIYEDLDFDSPNNLALFQIGDQYGNTMSIEEIHEKILRDGVVYWGEFNSDEEYGGGLSDSQNIGTGVHLRYKINDQVCHAILLWDTNHENASNDGVGYGGCAFQNLSIELASESPGSVRQEKQGMMILHPQRWIEEVIWLELEEVNNREQMVFYGMAWDPENPAAYLATKVLLPNWGNVDGYTLGFQTYGGEYGLDQFQLIRGDLLAFLWNNSASFQKYPERILDFFSTAPGERD